MPSLELTLGRLERLLDKVPDVEQLEYDLLWLGLDLDDVREDAIKVEYEPNRPDYSSPEGVARALRGYYGLEKGIPQYELGRSDVVVTVEPGVREVRPYLVSGLVRNVELEDDEIATLMNIQEALHHVLGRGRKKVAIGVHDYDKVQAPFRYTAVKPDAITFRPLQMEAFEMTPEEILEEHPKGIEYAHILAGADVYPIIFDANDDVVSFPPIINGYLTTVTEYTRTLFLDLTGTDLRAVSYALNILTTCLADMGTVVETVQVNYAEAYGTLPAKTIVTPDYAPTRWEVGVKYINDYIGLALSAEEMITCLEKVRFNARVHPDKPGHLLVEVPAYRVDLMHPVDIVEEVAIGYNYKNMPLTIREGAIGKYHPVPSFSNRVRSILAWAGYVECFNFVLTNVEREFDDVGLPGEADERVHILNPVSLNYNTTRVRLVPSLLQNLKFNLHEEKPIRIFEVGDVVVLDPAAQTGGRRDVHAAAMTYHAEANFTEMRSVLDFLARQLGMFDQLHVEPVSHPTYIEGRAGEIHAGNQLLGTIGEVHPAVLERFELEFPVATFELNLEPLVPKE